MKNVLKVTAESCVAVADSLGLAASTEFPYPFLSYGQNTTNSSLTETTAQTGSMWQERVVCGIRELIILV